MPLATDTVTLATLALPAAQIQTTGVWVYRFATSPEVKLTVANTDSQTHDTTGWDFLQVEFIPSGPTTINLVPVSDASDEVYVDGLVVVNGEYSGGYFDGDTPDAGGYTYAWTGTPHASTSTRELVEDPTTEITISGMTARYYTTVPKTSGPWVGGLGHTGVRFTQKPSWIPYSGSTGDEIGFSASFREVGDGL